MQAHELFPTAFVMHEGELCQVESVDSAGTCSLTKGSSTYTNVRIGELEAAPITEDVLMRLGFKNEDGFGYVFPLSYGNAFYSPLRKSLTFPPSNEWTCVFLHDLQRLFYIMEEEL